VATQHGASILIERWTRLAESLEASGDWNEVEQSHALDLLGLPRDLRNGHTPIEPPEGVNSTEFRLDLIATRIERLTDRISRSLESLELFHREHAEATFGAELSKTGQLIHRYEKEAWNRFMQARRELRPQQAKGEPRSAEARTAEASTMLDRKVMRLISDQSKAVRAQVEESQVIETPGSSTSEVFEAPQVFQASPMRSIRDELSTNTSNPVGFLAPTRPSNRRQRRAERAQSR
jgi:hypothetical protein